MTDPVFVDTNIFVHRDRLPDPAKKQLANQWIERFVSTPVGRLGYQALQGLYATLARSS